MALEWGVTPVAIPECADVEELWATLDRGRAETGHRRARRPRRDHSRHRGQHPRLDERDQGRHRLAAGRNRRTTAESFSRGDPAGTRRAAALREGGRRGSPRRSSAARPQRSTILLRWCVLGTIGLVAFLYYRPLSSYLETRSTLNERAAEVQSLRQERRRLQAPARRLHHGAGALARGAADGPREAGRAALHRQGRRSEWRRAQAQHGRGYHRAEWMTVRSSSGSSAGAPRAFRRVAARCPFGAPAVTEQAPYDDAGDPFPTTYYLTCPQLVAAVSRLEAAGGVERWSEAVGARSGASRRRPRAGDRRSSASSDARSPPARAGRDDGASLELGIGGSANPQRLKCLHAHAAYALARPGLPAGRARARRDRSGAGRRNAAAPSSRIERMVSPRPKSRARGATGRRGYRRLLEQARDAPARERLHRQVDASAPSFAAASAACSRCASSPTPTRAPSEWSRAAVAEQRPCPRLAADAVARRGGRVPPLRARRAGLQPVSTPQRRRPRPPRRSPLDRARRSPRSACSRCSCSGSRSAGRSRTGRARADADERAHAAAAAARRRPSAP